jgi:hypothetical protein
MEHNRLRRMWIWFWYNDITRLCILFGVPVIPVVLGLLAIFGPGEYLRDVGAGMYLLLVAWAILDNDYSQLRRIGLDEYRRRIRSEG